MLVKFTTVAICITCLLIVV